MIVKNNHWYHRSSITYENSQISSEIILQVSIFHKKIIVIYDDKSIDQNDLFDEGQLEQLIESDLKIELETDMTKSIAFPGRYLYKCNCMGGRKL